LQRSFRQREGWNTSRRCHSRRRGYENLWLAYPPAVAKEFSPELAELAGYVQHRPNLGNLEGQCPSVLLSDKVPEFPQATDSLRPDQKEAVREFAKTRRGGR
jgi:hypothetical protein